MPGYKVAGGVAAVALAMVAYAQPVAATPTYVFQQTIGVPSVPGNSLGLLGYDLATVDPSNQLLYLTDRSNNAIDVISTSSNTFIGRIGAGLYSGLGSFSDGFAKAGPNGVSINTLSDGTKLLVTTNGDSTVVDFRLAANGVTVLGSPTTISTAVAGTPVPANRADGVAYSAANNTILAVNGAASSSIITLISNATGSVVKSLVLDGTGGVPSGSGAEGTVFNSVTGTFFVAIPQFGATGPGGLVEIDPATGALIQTYDLSALGLAAGASCAPFGVAQGRGATLFLACSDPSASVQSILLNPLGGGSIQLVNGISGADAADSDPTRNVFFEASSRQPGGPALGVVDATTGELTQILATTTFDHAVAVDPVSGNVYVPFGASLPGAPNTICSGGCIGVFAVQVPEPSPLPTMLFGVAALIISGRLGRRAKQTMLPSART